ncbi:hypothetical protein EYC59_05740 [Candidatus Saccharibacteria bacterium]|nr:MAG: hypothetical protein EYC59_05740 [Candidatus Saccharibacteria bacterium]
MQFFDQPPVPTPPLPPAALQDRLRYPTDEIAAQRGILDAAINRADSIAGDNADRQVELLTADFGERREAIHAYQNAQAGVTVAGYLLWEMLEETAAKAKK